MKKYVALYLFFICFFGIAQNEVKEIQDVIDQEVWKPFQEAFENLDGKALNATYTEQVLRVTPNGIDTENSFKAGNLERFKQNKADGISISLEFWFDSRHTNEATSYEVGFYRIRATTKEGKTSSNYGQFHIVLKRIDGKWKITQDWDTSIINGKAISAEDFEKQEPLKF
ncbi:hypothetical protein MTsPCn9_13090 [Croceitalea sp. MTPC9]|uniref:YybH family protein n=1 Tax=unclassified Croceitalea TaxID=2632280 RepID=UPI002B3FA0E0|nr:hypothetical protein MTsPCn6_16040 [Croceitalea sp. MTPC6]GMN16373.1 hypothetical protein MTsPCn9_13090 [Croceitalea sp. MTPC9]